MSNASIKGRGSYRKTHEMFTQEVCNLVGDEYSILGTYKTSKIKIEIKHNLCDYSYFIAPNDFLKGRRCSKCAGNKKKTTEEFKAEVYSLVKDEYEVVSDYKNDKTKLEMKHNKCKNVYPVKPNVFLSGYRCPYCAGQKATYETSLGVVYPELIEEWNLKNKLSIFHVLPQSNKRAWWICKTCNHEWENEIYTRTGKYKNGCPVCRESKGEKRIRNWLKDNSIIFESQKEFEGLLGLGGKNLSYDFFLPKYNILIEFQGEQHEKFIKGLHIKRENFKKQQEHDSRKREYAELHNIKLLEIWYRDFEGIEEILKDKIIK
jgi:hypothetical protein